MAHNVKEAVTSEGTFEILLGANEISVTLTARENISIFAVSSLHKESFASDYDDVKKQIENTVLTRKKLMAADHGLRKSNLAALVKVQYEGRGKKIHDPSELPKVLLIGESSGIYYLIRAE